MRFTKDEIRELPAVFSAPRFATYLRASGNEAEAALSLYHWNLMISAAFVVPLQVCEVAVRNGVVDVLERVHGPNWPWSNGFIRSLSSPRRGYDPKLDLREVASRMPTAGKAVAELKLAFWEKLFTVGQDARLWDPYLHVGFPGMDASLPIATSRARAHRSMETMRKFRNRIAHHEPIFTRDICVEYDRLREIISWRSPVAAAWMDRTQNVKALLTQKP